MRRPCAALTSLIVLSLAVSCSSSSSSHRSSKSDPMPATAAKAADPLEKLHWRLGMQAWTFRKLSLFETLDMCKRLDVHYLEMYPGQKLAPDSDVKADHNMPADQIDRLLSKCKEAGVTPVSYGVVDVGSDEKSARKVFDFAKKLGLEQIVAEPVPTMAATVDNLATEYGIRLAIHDHPKPSRYWNPDAVLQFCQGRSERIGSCADVGHWQRSKVNPVEGLKKLEGKVFESHFKDLNEFGVKGAKDVPWGTGKGDAAAMLAECHRQTKAGAMGGKSKKMTFNIEYETGHGVELVQNMAKCIEWFGQQCGQLATK